MMHHISMNGCNHFSVADVKFVYGKLVGMCFSRIQGDTRLNKSEQSLLNGSGCDMVRSIGSNYYQPKKKNLRTTNKIAPCADKIVYFLDDGRKQKKNSTISTRVHIMSVEKLFRLFAVISRQRASLREREQLAAIETKAITFRLHFIP